MVIKESLIYAYPQVMSMLKERLGISKDENLPEVDYRSCLFEFQVTWIIFLRVYFFYFAAIVLYNYYVHCFS